MALRSKLPYQIRYALDCLCIYSSEYSLRFVENPELLDTLVEYMQDCLSRIETKNEKFYTYRELYEFETMALEGLQPGTGTFDTVKELAEQLCAVGLILRNASIHPENLAFMSVNQGLISIIYQTLNLPIPEELEDEEDRGLCTVPLCHVLEHRKNALMTLSCIGARVEIPDIKTAQLILKVCADFISEKNMYYVYPATDALAKLYLSSRNQQLFSQCDGLAGLCVDLLRLMPSNGFTYDTTPQQMALWELAMLILCTTVTIVDHSLQRSIIKIPGFLTIMLKLSKRPFSPPYFRAPLELLQQFVGIRERAFKTWLLCGRLVVPFRELEEKVLLMMVVAQRDGDLWMVSLILDFLADFGG